jgi:signal transduction histidine kinase/ActR/RegA family two-component response regulator
VGTLTLIISPEQVGRGFIGTLGTLVSGLALEFILLASALAIIFHWSLVRPLTFYTAQIDAMDYDSLDIQGVGVPDAHETDELGLLISKTNEMITRIGEQRETLVHREKIAALGTMLTGAAHELNNPLAVISAQAQILKETSEDPAIIARADKIIRPTERCSRIIKSFLELARQRKLEKKPTRLEEAIADAVELVAYQFESHNVTLNLKIDHKIPVMLADTTQISQAVMNLLLNAQQALAEQGPPHTIDLLVTQQGDTAFIKVMDNGPGIPEKDRPRVIEPFFTTKPKGTGLGLAFCHNVAIAHGGSLTVEAAEPRGTVVTLAMKIEATEFPQQESKPAHIDRKLKILVVDDEVALTESFSEALTLQGHKVETESDGASALNRISETEFDVVVADIRMPGMSGIELYQNAGSICPGLRERFIFVSGEPQSDATETFLNRHSAPCLVKPVDIGVLRQAIEQRIHSS